MQKHLPRILFVLLCVTIVILPLLPRAEVEAEYTCAKEMAVHISYSYITDETTMYFYNSDGMVAELTSPEWERYLIDFSLTRSSAFVMPTCNFDGNAALYYIDDSGALPIAEGVFHAVASDCESGVYVTDLADDHRTGQLNYYTNGKSSCIEPLLCTQLNFGKHISPAISPDGKTAAYCRRDDNGGIWGMVYCKGTYIELGKDIFPIAVSNDMEYLYYAKLSVPNEETDSEMPIPLTAYYVRSDAGDVLLGEGTSAHFLFNRDYSEAIVSGSAFGVLCTDGGNMLQTFSGYYPQGLIAPRSGLAVDISYTTTSPFVSAFERIGVDSFIGKFLHCDSGGFAHDICLGSDCPYHKIVYIDEQLQMRTITDTSYFFQLAEEGSAALYRNDGALYLIPDFTDGSIDDAVCISEYSSMFTGNADFSTVYYTNTAGTLYSYSKGKLSMVAQDVQFFAPNISPRTHAYDPGMPSARINGSIYFKKNADQSIWCISPEGAVEELTSIPKGAGLWVLGDTLLFPSIADNGIDVYRLDGDSAVKIMSGIAPAYVLE